MGLPTETKTWLQGGQKKVVITTGDHKTVVITTLCNKGSVQDGYYNSVKQRHGCGVIDY